MTDVEYPKWLVDELAEAIGEQVIEHFGTISGTGATGAAVAVLKHLNFKRTEEYGTMSREFPSLLIRGYTHNGMNKKHERWIGGTEWKEVEDN